MCLVFWALIPSQRQAGQQRRKSSLMILKKVRFTFIIVETHFFGLTLSFYCVFQCNTRVNLKNRRQYKAEPLSVLRHLKMYYLSKYPPNVPAVYLCLVTVFVILPFKEGGVSLAHISGPAIVPRSHTLCPGAGVTASSSGPGSPSTARLASLDVSTRGRGIV